MSHIVSVVMPNVYFLFTYSSKPLVCVFPALFKQNLLSFIYLVHPALSRTSVLRLLKCLSQDPHPNPWVTALGRQLERSLGAHNEEPLYTPLCGQRLQELLQRVGGFGGTGGWKCLSRHTAESTSQSASGLSELRAQRKRKGSFVNLDSDGEEMGQQSKRIKMDVCNSEHVDAEESSVLEETSERSERTAPAETPGEVLQPAPDSPCDALPEHIKVELCPAHTVIHLALSQLYYLISSHQRTSFCTICVYLGLCSSNKRVTGKSDRGKTTQHS